jgi:hypothetical protein
MIKYLLSLFVQKEPSLRARLIASRVNSMNYKKY